MHGGGDVEDVRAKRLAQNETIFRQVNEHVRAAEERVRHDFPRFICECSNIECDEQIPIALDEYRTVRESPTRFIVAAGHAEEEIERIVEHRPNYEVVEKVGPGRQVAEDDAAD